MSKTVIEFKNVSKIYKLYKSDRQRFKAIFSKKIKVKIPAGTQSGTTLRLKGKGVKDLRGNGYGDQMVKVEVKIPTKLSSKEKSLYEQLQKLSKKESIFESFKKGFKR